MGRICCLLMYNLNTIILASLYVTVERLLQYYSSQTRQSKEWLSFTNKRTKTTLIYLSASQILISSGNLYCFNGDYFLLVINKKPYKLLIHIIAQSERNK